MFLIIANPLYADLSALVSEESRVWYDEAEDACADILAERGGTPFRNNEEWRNLEAECITEHFASSAGKKYATAYGSILKCGRKIIGRDRCIEEELGVTRAQAILSLIRKEDFKDSDDFDDYLLEELRGHCSELGILDPDRFNVEECATKAKRSSNYEILVAYKKNRINPYWELLAFIFWKVVFVVIIYHAIKKLLKILSL